MTTNPGSVPKTAKRPQPKGGSRLGKPNKSTQTAREAIAKFVDGNADRLAGWLDEIAADNPQRAFDAFMSVVEYHVPKLARTEVTGKDGEAVQHSIKVSFG